MEFGLQFFPDVGPDVKPASQYWGECLYLASLADELGYTHIRTVEQHFQSYGGNSQKSKHGKRNERPTACQRVNNSGRQGGEACEYKVKSLHRLGDPLGFQSKGKYSIFYFCLTPSSH